MGSILALAIVASACFKKQPVSATYEKDGLTFTHFSDWHIKEDKLIDDTNVRLITIEGPSNAVMVLTQFSSDNPITLDQYANSLDEERKNAVKEQFGGALPLSAGKARTEPTVLMIAGESQRGLRQAFNVRLFGVDVPHKADLSIIERGGSKWVVMAQASDEDWASVQPGFQKMFDSMTFAAEGKALGNHQ